MHRHTGHQRARDHEQHREHRAYAELIRRLHGVCVHEGEQQRGDEHSEHRAARSESGQHVATHEQFLPHGGKQRDDEHRQEKHADVVELYRPRRDSAAESYHAEELLEKHGYGQESYYRKYGNGKEQNVSVRILHGTEFRHGGEIVPSPQREEPHNQHYRDLRNGVINPACDAHAGERPRPAREDVIEDVAQYRNAAQGEQIKASAFACKEILSHFTSYTSLATY